MIRYVFVLWISVALASFFELSALAAVTVLPQVNVNNQPVSKNSFNVFLENFVAERNFEVIDEDYQNSDYVRPGLNRIIQHSKPLIMGEAFSENEASSFVTAPLGFYTTQKIDEDWCIQHAYRGSYAVLKQFYFLQERTWDVQQKTLMNMLMFMYANKKLVVDFCHSQASSKAVEDVLKKSFSREVYNQYLSILQNAREGKAIASCSTNFYSSYFTYQLYMFLRYYDSLISLMVNGSFYFQNNGYVFLKNVLLKSNNRQNALFSYAAILGRENIHTTWDGENVTHDDVKRYQECGRLLKLDGSLIAKVHYAQSLVEKKIHKTWDGEDVIQNDMKRYQECGRLWMQSGSLKSMEQYAILLAEKKIHKTWDGQDVTKNDVKRAQECKRLLIAKCACCAEKSYNHLFINGNLQVTWGGVNVAGDDVKRYQEYGRIFKLYPGVKSKKSYAILLAEKKIHKAWDGEDVTNDDLKRAEECERLLQLDDSLNGKYNYAVFLYRCKDFPLSWSNRHFQRRQDVLRYIICELVKNEEYVQATEQEQFSISYLQLDCCMELLQDCLNSNNNERENLYSYDDLYQRAQDLCEICKEHISVEEYKEYLEELKKFNDQRKKKEHAKRTDDWKNKAQVQRKSKRSFAFEQTKRESFHI